MLKNCVTFSNGEVNIWHIVFQGCSKPNRNLQKMKILGNKKVVKLIGQWSLKNGTFMYHFFQQQISFWKSFHRLNLYWRQRKLHFVLYFLSSFCFSFNVIKKHWLHSKQDMLCKYIVVTLSREVAWFLHSSLSTKYKFD